MAGGGTTGLIKGFWGVQGRLVWDGAAGRDGWVGERAVAALRFSASASR